MISDLTMTAVYIMFFIMLLLSLLMTLPLFFSFLKPSLGEGGIQKVAALRFELTGVSALIDLEEKFEFNAVLLQAVLHVIETLPNMEA